MQKFDFKYEISPRALLQYYGNFLRRAGIRALCLQNPWRHGNLVEIFRLLKWQVQKRET